ncbi:thymocyte nuclear protein 1-like [Scleropages formosus]|uniref:Thymocyte nuclear protein 1 n=1 Tax=Scleropages formosus TaxID=113540 RepID=A0A0P7U5V8_SCLFO|nr:thymocyte nuclear protein 1-like [Scleropages formosus]
MPPKKRLLDRLLRSSRSTGDAEGAPAKSGKAHLEGSSEEVAEGTRVKRRKRAEAKESAEEKGKAKDVLAGKRVYCHWLMKSEPESRLENGIDVKFGIEDLKALPNQTGCWDGVRNYQIVKEAYVDHTQFDKTDVHYDASSKAENPKWYMVDVQFERMTKRFLSLAELKKYHIRHKAEGGALRDLALFTRARLSVQPLTAEEFDFILSLEDKDPI